MDFPPPKWLLEIPDGPEKERALERFLLQLACIYTSPEGRIGILADELNLNYQTLKSQMTDGRRIGRHVPRDTWIRVEDLLGPDFIPAEFRAKTKLVANG